MELNSKIFRIFSTETGYDFGVFLGFDAENAICQLSDQAGESVNRETIEVWEITASSFSGKSSFYLFRIALGVSGVRVVSAFGAEETVVVFPDGSGVVAQLGEVREMTSFEIENLDKIS